MSNKIIIFISIIVVVIIIGAGTTLWPQLISAPEKQILNFEDCVVGGNPIMETYPRQCRHGDQTFVENVSLSMSREEAVQIAGETQECTTVGIPTAEISYNEGTKTWWIDLVRTPELETDGCHPACVVSEETKTAEVNWRCTGAIPDDGGDQGILPFDSGVQGQVLLGPVCPIMQNPPLPECADKPYQTTVQVIAIGSPKSSPFATVESDEDGRYKILLPPGEYGIQPVRKSPLPRCETRNITIKPNEIQELNLSCDSGIR